MELSPAIIWLLAGLVMVTLEAFAAPGVGLLFAGLAAICVGVLVHLGIAFTLVSQFAWMCGLTVLWAVLLWKPMKKFYAGKTGVPYSNIAGSTGIVISDKLTRHTDGQIRWSGTVMQARIERNDPAEEIPKDQEVEIVEIQGNLAFVRPVIAPE